MTTWNIERLAKHHERSAFDCGHPSLNDWLQQRAGQHDRKDLSRTFVATLTGATEVVGYYAIATHCVMSATLPVDQAKGLPPLDVPVALLGRLAVDQKMQGQGLGSYLLIDALRRVSRLADEIGIRAIEVDAIDHSAKTFYLKFGFCELLDNPRHLFLSMQVVRKLRLDRP
jgi:GNAT superfamily N-acetyltransferase